MENKGVLIRTKNAEELHDFLAQNGYLATAFRPMQVPEGIIFPLSEKGKRNTKAIKKKFPKTQINDSDFAERDEKPKTLRQALAGKLSRSELSILPSSFDTLGDCVILELAQGLLGKAKIIANALMGINKSVKSVFLKTGAHQGVFRQEPVEFIAGKRTDRATYKENGCVFKISIGRVFFSPRLSTERKRISGLIKRGENIAALFAGVGPFPIIFAKKSDMGSAVAIELNPVAVADMEENIKLNKVEGKVLAVLGDVNELAGKKDFFGKFDRAVMPLPKGGEDFLESAIKYIKPGGGVVHYYQFVPRENPFELPKKQIAQACKNLGRKFEVLAERKVREYAPGTIQVVVDFWVCK